MRHCKPIRILILTLVTTMLAFTQLLHAGQKEQSDRQLPPDLTLIVWGSNALFLFGAFQTGVGSLATAADVYFHVDHAKRLRFIKNQIHLIDALAVELNTLSAKVNPNVLTLGEVMEFDDFQTNPRFENLRNLLASHDPKNKFQIENKTFPLNRAAKHSEIQLEYRLMSNNRPSSGGLGIAGTLSVILGIGMMVATTVVSDFAYSIASQNQIPQIDYKNLTVAQAQDLLDKGRKFATVLEASIESEALVE